MHDCSIPSSFQIIQANALLVDEIHLFTSYVHIGINTYDLLRYNQMNLTMTYNESLKNFPFLEYDDKFALTIAADKKLVQSK